MKLNNKGFAVSTILYGVLSIIILILLIILGVMKSNKDINEDLVDNLTESMNTCATYEAKLENCYFNNSNNCNDLVSVYENCINDEEIKTLKDAVIMNNVGGKNAENINYSQSSSQDGTKGLYYTSTNTENNETTYFFRGAVTNNYVRFAGFLWRIVRINEDGSVRLISDESIGEVKYNTPSDDNAYIGYMYGEIPSTSKGKAHNNEKDSTIKTFLDSWYETNLIKYSNYLADAGFCNDKNIGSVAGSWATDDTALGYRKNITYYEAYNRINNLQQPQFACSNAIRDLFTTKTANKGTQKLEHPIGLITADEVMYAGGQADASNNSYYLYTGYGYWTMSPVKFNGTYAYEWNVDNVGFLNSNFGAHSNRGVRPVINLKDDVEIISGDGTFENEYVVKTQ